MCIKPVGLKHSNTKIRYELLNYQTGADNRVVVLLRPTIIRIVMSKIILNSYKDVG